MFIKKNTQHSIHSVNHLQVTLNLTALNKLSMTPVKTMRKKNHSKKPPKFLLLSETQKPDSGGRYSPSRSMESYSPLKKKKKKKKNFGRPQPSSFISHRLFQRGMAGKYQRASSARPETEIAGVDLLRERGRTRCFVFFDSNRCERPNGLKSPSIISWRGPSLRPAP